MIIIRNSRAMALLAAAAAAAAATIAPVSANNHIQAQGLISQTRFECSNRIPLPGSFQAEPRGIAPSVLGDMVPIDTAEMRCEPQGKGIVANNHTAMLESDLNIKDLIAFGGMVIELWIIPADHAEVYGGKPRSQYDESELPILPIVRIGREGSSISQFCDNNQVLISQKGPHMVLAYVDGDTSQSCRVQRIQSHRLEPNVPVQYVFIIAPRKTSVYVDGKLATEPFDNAYQKRTFSANWDTASHVQIMPNIPTTDGYFDGIVHSLGFYTREFGEFDGSFSNFIGRMRLNEITLEPTVTPMPSESLSMQPTSDPKYYSTPFPTQVPSQSYSEEPTGAPGTQHALPTRKPAVNESTPMPSPALVEFEGDTGVVPDDEGERTDGPTEWSVPSSPPSPRMVPTMGSPGDLATLHPSEQSPSIDMLPSEANDSVFTAPATLENDDDDEIPADEEEENSRGIQGIFDDIHKHIKKMRRSDIIIVIAVFFVLLCFCVFQCCWCSRTSQMSRKPDSSLKSDVVVLPTSFLSDHV